MTREYSSIAFGIDAQPRGLAVAQLDLVTGEFIAVDWHPIPALKLLEPIVFHAGEVARQATCELFPAVVTIELPTARASSQFMPLWCICGAVIAAVYPNSLLVEGIVPISWKKYSGLNFWAKEGKQDKKGVVPKDLIPLGIKDLVPGTPIDLEPVDMYDSIAIALAGLNRNLERIGREGLCRQN
jgi:hypothetical protein